MHTSVHFNANKLSRFESSFELDGMTFSVYTDCETYAMRGGQTTDADFVFHAKPMDEIKLKALQKKAQDSMVVYFREQLYCSGSTDTVCILESSTISMHKPRYIVFFHVTNHSMIMIIITEVPAAASDIHAYASIFVCPMSSCTFARFMPGSLTG